MRGEFERFVGIWQWHRTSWTPHERPPPMHVMEADSQAHTRIPSRSLSRAKCFGSKDGEQLQKFNLKVEKCEGRVVVMGLVVIAA